MGMSTDKAPALSPATEDILNTLNDAARLFSADLAQTLRKGGVSHLRDALVSSALVRALQVSLGNSAHNGPALVSGLLGELQPL